jgi:glyoxylase-like metal-dependent hydrolase (beta-lactamase superfamily II)
MLRPRELGPGLAAFEARTPTLPPATHTQSYALGTRDLILVEPATPFEDEQREWLAWARSLVSSGRNLIGIFLTHHHSDHVGGAEVLSRELGAPLFGHAMTQERLPDLRISRLLDEGDVLTLDGPVPQRWQVLFTPGHAPGHLCLFEPEQGHLIVGDMIASIGTILIETRDGDMSRYLVELERLAKLGAKTGYPAHGDPIVEPEGLFRHYILHRTMREKKVLAALGQMGAPGATAADLVPVAYDDTPPRAWPLARLAIEAHLVKLVTEGRARCDGERHYAA